MYASKNMSKSVIKNSTLPRKDAKGSEVKVFEKPNELIPSPSMKIVNISASGKKDRLQKFPLRTSASKPNIVRKRTKSVVKTANRFVDDLPANSVATMTDVHFPTSNSVNDGPYCRLKAAGDESENGKVMFVATDVVPWEQLTEISKEQKSFRVRSSSLVSECVEKPILFDSTPIGGPPSTPKRRVTISNDIFNRIQSLKKNTGIFGSVYDFGNEDRNKINPTSKDVPTCAPAERDGMRMKKEVDGVVVTSISGSDDRKLLLHRLDSYLPETAVNTFAIACKQEKDDDNAENSAMESAHLKTWFSMRPLCIFIYVTCFFLFVLVWLLFYI